ncbi:substrate-binding periplasmic protein [Spartinivicinus poritis]|uniref:Transporter substrate-binding domain-containing protein n=1 Tax=Spartinivicinus poritis TaxID=2994640 RepID=A0ABT5UGC3_9GAMM|nr:transporter substrate-binding domain-containing protein [Spartinivicinus sp. A2-2]MDE1465426.1 transporter substrate-binding domain-containing protein [Spartinivicinus sp. A2-2]
MRRIIESLSLYGILFFLMSSSLYASEDNIILLSEEANSPPYSYESDGTPTKGLSLALMNGIFAHLGAKMDLKLFPWKRCLIHMKQGTRDALTVLSINEERKEFLEFTEPHLEIKGYVYYSAAREKGISWNSFEDLKGFKIGVVAGFNYGKEFEKSKKELSLQISEVTRLSQNFEKLTLGRIDIMLANQAEAGEFIRLNPKYKGKIKHAEKPYIVYQYRMAFSKKSNKRHFIPKINDVIKKMKSNGELDSIVSNFF